MFPDLANVKDMVTFPGWYFFFFGFLLIFVTGAAVVYATWRGGKFFVDPSADMLFAGTNIFLKKLIGAKGLQIFWYFLGGFVLMIGLVGVILGLGDLFVHLGIVPR
jgi:hypothetical protein